VIASNLQRRREAAKEKENQQWQDQFEEYQEHGGEKHAC